MSQVSTDPIADMLTRIRNAIGVNKNEIDMPHSKIKESIAKLLVSNGFIRNVRVSGTGINKTLTIVINNPDENAKITEIKRLSKPGRRYYAGCDEIPVVKRGRGLVIVSTSRGLMTGDQAKKSRIGGELVCSIY